MSDLLVEAVRQQTYLDRRSDDGTTLRERFEREWTKTKIRPKQYVEPAVPMAGLHIWEWFWQLHCRRGIGFGASPISIEAIAALGQLLRVSIAPWEALTIMAMDDAYLTEANPPKAKTKRRHQATAENTKALFKGLGTKIVRRTVESPSKPHN